MAVHVITGPRGDEVRVETGIGRILRLVPKGERNVQVVIDAEHLGLEVTAWVDRQGPVWPRVEKAAPADDAPGMKVWYRIDVHRKAKTDPAIPLAQVDRRDKVRDLVGLERPENAPAAIEGAVEAEPAPTAPPATGGPTQAPPGPAAAAPAPADDESDPEARYQWLGQLDSALAAGEAPQVIRFLEQTLLDLGVTQAAIDSVKRARREHTARTVPLAPPPEATIPDDPPSRQIERHRGPAPDPRWDGVVPEGVDPAKVAGLLERMDHGSPPVSKAAHDALGKMGVNIDAARAALAEAKDPDRVGAQAPTPAAPEPDPGPEQGRPRPAVAPVSGLSRRASAIASDAKPWEFTNTDGRINLSSYAAGAVMEVTNLAGRLLITRARNRHAEAPETELVAPTESQVYGLASTLLNVADQIQHRSRDGGRVDRMAASHRLARQALREGLDLYPVPWGAAEADIAAWRDALVEHGTTTINVGLALLQGQPPAGIAAS